MNNFGFSAFSDFKDLEKNCENCEIVIYNAGFYLAKKSSSVVKCHERNYLMIYQHIGSSTVTLKETVYHLTAGSVFIYPPHSFLDIEYGNDAVNERYYIFFNGTIIDSLLNDLSINKPHLKIGLCNEFIDATNFLITELRKPHYGNKTLKAITLLNLFAVISKTYTKHDDIISSSYDVIAPALIFMHDNIKSKILSPDEYANICLVSRTTFAKHFKIHTQQTPTQYFTNLKISNIKLILIETNKTVSEVSYEFGFDDPLYFSRIFKSYTGFSPLTFRKLFKKQ